MKRLVNLSIGLLLVCAGNVFCAASSSAASSISGSGPSYFAQRRDGARGEIEKLLHPILHGIADKGDGFFPELGALCKGGWQVLDDAVHSRKDQAHVGAQDLLAQAKRFASNQREWLACILQMVTRVKLPKDDEGKKKWKQSQKALKVISKRSDQILDTLLPEAESQYEKAARYASMLDSMNKDDVAKIFPHWDEGKCPGGILECKHLGHLGKEILKSLQAFFDNIEKYESSFGGDYFSVDTEVDSIFNFVKEFRNVIIEQQIAHLGKDGASEGSPLKGFQRVAHYLAALPTTFHDPTDDLERNKEKMDRVLKDLPLRQRRNLEDFTGTLGARARDRLYGRRDTDTGTNLVLAGESGSGKTYTAEAIQACGGFAKIKVKASELEPERGQSLVEVAYEQEAHISVLEALLLQLKPDGKSGIAALNQVVFVDEFDKDCGLAFSAIKDEFCQFKKMRLPSLGLTVPGFLHFIFTTNNPDFIYEEDAMANRFSQIIFERMPKKKKVSILYGHLLSKLESIEGYASLGETYDFKKVVQKLVRFDARLNIRYLTEGIDDILWYFYNREKKLASPSSSDDPIETFAGFLHRKYSERLGRLDEDGNESDEEDFSDSELLTGAALYKSYWAIPSDSDDDDDEEEFLFVPESSAASAAGTEVPTDDDCRPSEASSVPEGKGKAKSSREEVLDSSKEEGDKEDCALISEKGSTPVNSNPASPWNSDDDEFEYGGVTVESMTSSPSREEADSTEFDVSLAEGSVSGLMAEEGSHYPFLASISPEKEGLYARLMGVVALLGGVGGMVSAILEDAPQ